MGDVYIKLYGISLRGHLKGIDTQKKGNLEAIMAIPTETVHIRKNFKYLKIIFELCCMNFSRNLCAKYDLCLSFTFKVYISFRLIDEEGKSNHATGKRQDIQHTRLENSGGKNN